jgi:hypothetical protein
MEREIGRNRCAGSWGPGMRRIRQSGHSEADGYVFAM